MEHFVGLALSGLTRIYLLVSYQLCKQKHVQSQQQSQLIVCTLFKVNIMTREQQWWRCLYVFIFNFETHFTSFFIVSIVSFEPFCLCKNILPDSKTTNHQITLLFPSLRNPLLCKTIIYCLSHRDFLTFSPPQLSALYQHALVILTMMECFQCYYQYFHGWYMNHLVMEVYIKR